MTVRVSCGSYIPGLNSLFKFILEHTPLLLRAHTEKHGNSIKTAKLEIIELEKSMQYWVYRRWENWLGWNGRRLIPGIWHSEFNRDPFKFSEVQQSYTCGAIKLSFQLLPCTSGYTVLVLLLIPSLPARDAPAHPPSRITGRSTTE